MVYRRPSTKPLSQFVLFPVQKEKIREKFVEALKTEFAGKGLRFSRGTSFLWWARQGKLFTCTSFARLVQ